MTFNMACEVSETHLLYLGNNAFGELHCKPASTVHPDIVLLEEIQYTRELYHDHNTPEMYLTIKRGFDDIVRSTTVEHNDEHNEPNIEHETLQVKLERSDGTIHFDMINDRYIDWLKQESDIKLEKNESIKIEPIGSIVTPSKEELQQDQEFIKDVRSLSDHSATCQLRMSLELADKGPRSEQVMQCCIDPIKMVSSLDVAMSSPAAEISKGLMHSDIFLQTNQVLHVVTLRPLSLSVATSNSKEIQDPLKMSGNDSLNVATPRCESNSVLNVATTLSETGKTLSVATAASMLEVPIWLQTVGNLPNDADTPNTEPSKLSVASLPQMPSTEKTDSDPPMPLVDVLDKRKAARRTSPPHIWQQPGPELEVATATKSTDLPNEHI